MHSIALRSRPAARTMAPRVCARTTTRTLTAPSCSIPTATTSRRSVTRRREQAKAFPAEVDTGSAQEMRQTIESKAHPGLVCSKTDSIRQGCALASSSLLKSARSLRVPPAAGDDDAVRDDALIARHVLARHVDVVERALADRQHRGIADAAGFQAAELGPL